MRRAIAVLVMAFAVAAVNAAIIGELDILDVDANGGINPATGAAWQAGDTYRFAFTSSELTPATSTDINTYNTYVQNLANASSLNIGAAQGVTWKVIGSTATVDARDNTSTNITEDGTGESIFLLDGATRVATDYTALWGSDTHDNPINLTELLTTPPKAKQYGDTWTGSTSSGTALADGELGAVDDNDAMCGLWPFTSGAHWINRWGNSTDTELPVYGLSEPLEIVPEPASLALLGLAGAFLVNRRRR